MKTLEATVSAWGKSTAVRIPSALVRRSGLSIGQTVKVESAGEGVITITAVKPRPSLDALLTRVTPDNLPNEADISWGKPVGTEPW